RGRGGPAALPRTRLRRVPRDRLPRAHRHLRVVPDHRRGAQPHPTARADPRHPPPRDRGGHGHHPDGRLAQGRRGRDDRRGNPPRHPGRRLVQMPVFMYRAADRRGQTIDGVMEAPDARAVVSDLLRSVRGGASLSEALAKHHPRPFSRLYINMVRAGEKGGVLEVTLRRLAEFLESRAAFTEAILSALAYPLVVTAVGGAAVVFLLTFVIPRFATIFSDLKQAIPLPTQILMAVSSTLREYWWVGAIVIFAGIFAWRVWTRSPEGRLQWDRTLLGMPHVGSLVMKIEAARFARTLGTMLKSGVP